MLGGSIATTTAWIVTIDPFSILWLNWVAPSVVGTPIIMYFSSRELAKIVERPDYLIAFFRSFRI